jgi:hypothetical protein
MMATRKVTLTAEDIETVRRHIAQDRPIEAIAYLRRKYRDAGLGTIAPSARERVTTTWTTRARKAR